MGMFDDLADNGEAGQDRAAEIRKNAHVVNGGEALFSCPACKGRGKFISYSGRVVGDCYKCKGKGQVGKRTIAAEKGKQTRANNVAAWREENRDVIAYINTKAANGFNLMQRYQDKIREYETLRPEDVARVREFMERDAARAVEDRAKREAAAPVVDLTAIDKLFQTATNNKIKKPIFRADGITISRAPASGKNAGALYVTATDENAYGEKTYYGKLQNGKFYGTRAATKEIEDALMAIAADPLAESLKYSRRTGRCGCCGHVLVNPVSILAGIGPICAENFGLEFMRDQGRAQYEFMKAEEIATKQ
jgi:hypothetical protein